MKKSVAFLSLSIAALIGCGGDEPKKVVDTPDAPVVDTPDAPPVDSPPAANCTMASTVPTPTSQGNWRYVADDPATPDTTEEYWGTLMKLNEDVKADLMQIQLFQGFGTDFSTASTAAPLVVQLTGIQASWDTCAACLRAGTDAIKDDAGVYSLNPGKYADDYFAKGGTLTLTSATATKLTGTIENLILTHVILDIITQPATTTPVGDCDSMVGSITFDLAPVMAKNGALQIPVSFSKRQVTQ